MRVFLVLHIVCILVTGWGQTFTTSHLPIIIISTNEVIEDNNKVLAKLSIIDNRDGSLNKVTDPPSLDVNIGIEYRGSTSQGFDKKPFSIEIWDENQEDLDTSILDMPKESDWILNAAYNDKTLMRDMLSYILGGSLMEYAPRGRYCEMILNGRYEGIYIFGEKIKRDKNRVPVDKIENTDISGDRLTGGYIIKLDKETGGSNFSWNSQYVSIPGSWQRPLFQIDYPSSPNSSQYNYIKNHFDKLEDVIRSNTYDDPVEGWRKYIDEKSVLDFIIMNELAKNGDGYRLSTYMYKERDSDGGKIKMGPLWDFNLSFGNINYCTGGSPTGFVITNFNTVCRDDAWVIHFWWERFLRDNLFFENLRKRYSDLRKNQLSNQNIFGTIDSLAQLISPATGRNFQRWPILGTYVWPNSFVGQTYDEEINFLKNWTEERLRFLDSIWLISSLETDNPENIKIFPNPFYNSFTIKFENIFDGNIDLFDLYGKKIPISTERTSDLYWQINTFDLPYGTYILRFSSQNKVFYKKLMK
jgi:spore coat protein CotH